MSTHATLLAAALAALPALAAAAPVYTAEGFVIGDDQVIDFFDDDGDGIDVGYAEGDVGFGFFSEIFVTDTGGATLIESATELGAFEQTFDGGLVRFVVVFDGLAGDDAGLFADDLLSVRFTYNLNDLEDFGDSFGIAPVTAEVFAEIAAIPLPAGLPLLVLGLGGLAALRRRA